MEVRKSLKKKSQKAYEVLSPISDGFTYAQSDKYAIIERA